MKLTLEFLFQQLNCEVATNVFFLIWSLFCGLQACETAFAYILC